MSENLENALRLARERWLVAGWLTAAMVGAYFGFILLVAFNKPLMATPIAKGLSLGLPLGALVIACAWILTYAYSRWANAHFDHRVSNLGARR